MSNNKYIIDKDSLTGIADVIRDKLGTGDATTDGTTGKIIYPEDKGYYWKKQLACSFNTVQRSGTSYNSSSYEQCFLYSPAANNNISWDDIIVNWCGETPAKIKIVNKTYQGQEIYLYVSGTTTTLFSSWAKVDSEKIIPYQSFGNNQDVYIAINTPGSPYSGTSWTTPQLEISFLDEDNNFYAIKDGSTNFGFRIGSRDYNISFLEKDVKTLIPLSIGDIKNRITNYLFGGFDPIPTGSLTAMSGYSWYAYLNNEFTSIQDFRNRILQANINPGSSFFRLICKTNGRAASMKELGIPLPKNIRQNKGPYGGSWKINDVKVAYENNLTFPFLLISGTSVDIGTYWIYVCTDLSYAVACYQNNIGYEVANNGSFTIQYL